MATKTKAKKTPAKKTKAKAPAKRKPKAKKKETNGCEGCEGCDGCKCGEEAPPPTSEQDDLEKEMILMKIGQLVGMWGWGMMLPGEEGDDIHGCVIGTQDFCFDIAHAMGFSPVVGGEEDID